MDCRLHFKDVFFVSAPWYLQDKNTWPFSEETRAIGGGQRQGRRVGWWGREGGLCVNQIQWIIFFNVLQRELRIKGLLLPKERERQRKKNTKPTKAVKTFGPSVGAANAKQIGGIFFPLRFLNVPLFRAPQVHLHSVLCLVGASAQVNHGLPAKVPVCRVAIIIFCLFICTITDLSFKDTQDLWTSCFNRTKGHHVCSFYGTFFVLSSRLEPLIQTFKHPAAVVKTHD